MEEWDAVGMSLSTASTSLSPASVGVLPAVSARSLVVRRSVADAILDGSRERLHLGSELTRHCTEFRTSTAFW
jgi:hypothetical protein